MPMSTGRTRSPDAPTRLCGAPIAQPLLGDELCTVGIVVGRIVRVADGVRLGGAVARAEGLGVCVVVGVGVGGDVGLVVGDPATLRNVWPRAVTVDLLPAASELRAARYAIPAGKGCNGSTSRVVAQLRQALAGGFMSRKGAAAAKSLTVVIGCGA